MPANLKYFIYFLSWFSISQLNAATCISTGSGNWGTSSVWSCGAVPTCGDSIVIQAGHTVSITATYNHTGCGTKIILVIRGTLKFGNGDKLRLPCNSKLYVFTGGQIQSGGGSGSSNVIEICGSNEWSADDGTYTGPGCFPATAPGCSTILPVDLLFFKIKECGGMACLDWSTATEKNNDHFVIERSRDAFTFSPFVKMPAASTGGNSKEQLFYSITDDSPFNGLSYYRLSQVDRDGSRIYHGLVSFDWSAAMEPDVFISPNPSAGEFFLKSRVKNVFVDEIILSSALGEIVYHHPMSVSLDSDFSVMPDKKPGPGLYICSVRRSNLYKHFKLLIQ